jgi:hypothetical protein
MTNEHPITPPLELRRQWLDNDHFSMVTGTHDLLSITRDRLNSVIDQAAQWGADQELEACCKWLPKLPPWSGNDLRKHRRPKPPSLKEQALEALKALPTPAGQVTADRLDTIRRALAALPE